MKQTRLIIIFLIICPLVFMSPVRKEEENSETCRGDYCSMFEGICKNGGTCISKGCKGECKCTSEFTGHNCEVPNTPLTTEAPKPKKEKTEEESKAKDFSLILSLFRILSGPRSRPEVDNHVNKNTETVTESVSKTNKNTESDKGSSAVESKRGDSYPSRLESTLEKKEVSVEVENKDKLTDKQKLNNRKDENVVIKTTMIPDHVYSRSDITASTNEKLPTTRSSVSHDSSVQSKSSNSEISMHAASLHNFEITQSKNDNSRKEVNQPSSSTTVQTLTDSVTATNKPKSNIDVSFKNGSAVFNAKTWHALQNVFHAPRAKWESTAVKTTSAEMKPIITTNEDKTTTASNTTSGSAHIVNAGHKVLSSTTLSNLYLSHTLLSRSRIFVSTVPNKFEKNNDTLAKTQVTTLITPSDFIISEPRTEIQSVNTNQEIVQNSTEELTATFNNTMDILHDMNTTEEGTEISVIEITPKPISTSSIQSNLTKVEEIWSGQNSTKENASDTSITDTPVKIHAKENTEVTTVSATKVTSFNVETNHTALTFNNDLIASTVNSKKTGGKAKGGIFQKRNPNKPVLPLRSLDSILREKQNDSP